MLVQAAMSGPVAQLLLGDMAEKMAAATPWQDRVEAGGR